MPGLCDNNVFSSKYEGLYEMILFPPECVEENIDLYLSSQFLKASSEYTFGGYSSLSSFSRPTFSLRMMVVNYLARHICSWSTIRMKRMAFPWIFSPSNQHH